MTSLTSSPSSTLPLDKQILSEPDKFNQQTGSPLFNLPPEVRSEIFSYALTDYPDPDPDKVYNETTYYTRPSYLAPRKSDVALLQTCRAAYQECWFLPFLLREQVHWAVGFGERAPPGYRKFEHELDALRGTLQVIREQQQQPFEIRSLRIFAQMFMIEMGSIKGLLGLPDMNPRIVTLTIRHADWWYWENDEPLRFEGRWTRTLSGNLSASVNEFNIELESLQRKKYQVDELANQMMKRWSFKRNDGVVLYAHSKAESSWKGTSRWHGQRWIRDETSEGVIDFYIVTVTFLPESVFKAEGRDVSGIGEKPKDGRLYDHLKLYNDAWKAISCDQNFIQESEPEPEPESEPESETEPEPAQEPPRRRFARLPMSANSLFGIFNRQTSSPRR